MIVVDASVLTNALVDDDALGDLAREALRRDDRWAAPEHLVVETFSAVRGRLLGRKISVQRAENAVVALGVARIELTNVSGLLERMWTMRENVSAYDSAYVAVAQTLGCTLVTADRSLARASAGRCSVQLARPTG